MTNNNRTFGDLIKAVNDAANNAATLNDYNLGLSVADLAASAALSVVKKCYNVSGLKLLLNLKNDIIRYLADMGRKPLLEDCAGWTYNQDGDMVYIVFDTEMQEALEKLTAKTIGDGVAIAQEAAMCILDEIARQKKNGEIVDLERPYTIRHTSDRIRNMAEVSKPRWIDVKTTPIQQVYKAARGQVSINGSVRLNPADMYTYLYDLLVDEETGATADGYSRLLPMADLGGYVTNSNGERIAYTVNDDEIERVYKIIEMLGLTERERLILDKRLQGVSTDNIAAALHISRNSVISGMRRLREKARKIGLEPTAPRK